MKNKMNKEKFIKCNDYIFRKKDLTYISRNGNYIKIHLVINNENYTLNELNGYTIVGGVHVENIGLATEEEKTEIEKTLRSGFILPDKTT